MIKTAACLLVAGLMVGCAPKRVEVVPPDGRRGPPPARAFKAEFGKALNTLAAHDRANDWTPKACRDTAKQFLSAAERLQRVEHRRTEYFSARYNAALAYQRCNMSEPAKEVLNALVRDAPAFHRAKAQLVMYRFEESGDRDRAIGELEHLVVESAFKNVDALVSLATLLMERGGTSLDADGRDDFDNARLNLQRALAVDDGHLPALNHLAVFYLRQAGGPQTHLEVASAASSPTETRHATLELAALICSQAVRKDPRYAPIHNTAGLVHARLGDLSAAAKAFARARALDPKFFEAHMNYAAVNLQFRGFENAQHAYEEALAIRGRSYDALLGLSLALRGQVGTATNGVAMLTKAEKLLKRAKRVDGKRPEAFFNQAILLQEFRARGLPNEEAKKVLLAAKGQFGQFLALAEKRAEFDDARTRARERMRDIDEMLTFMQ